MTVFLEVDHIGESSVELERAVDLLDVSPLSTRTRMLPSEAVSSLWIGVIENITVEFVYR